MATSYLKYKSATPLPYIVKSYVSYMMSVKGLTLQTINAYISDLTVFFRFLKKEYGMAPGITYELIKIGDIDNEFIRRITLEDIYMFIAYLECDRHNGSETRTRKIVCLKSFFKYLHKKAKVIDVNIAEELEIPKKRKKNAAYLTEEQCIDLINNVDSRNPERDRCMIILFLNTGMRLSELCKINISDIENGVLTVIGKGDKERYVYLNSMCLNAIDNYMDIRQRWVNKGLVSPANIDALFLSERKQRISKRTVQNAIMNAIKSAKLDSKKYSTHKLRHTAATLLLSAGVDIRYIQEILGHDSISTTQRYTHIKSGELENVVGKNPLNKDYLDLV